MTAPTDNFFNMEAGIVYIKRAEFEAQRQECDRLKEIEQAARAWAGAYAEYAEALLKFGEDDSRSGGPWRRYVDAEVVLFQAVMGHDSGKLSPRGEKGNKQ